MSQDTTTARASERRRIAEEIRKEIVDLDPLLRDVLAALQSHKGFITSDRLLQLLESPIPDSVQREVDKEIAGEIAAIAQRVRGDIQELKRQLNLVMRPPDLFHDEAGKETAGGEAAQSPAGPLHEQFRREAEAFERLLPNMLETKAGRYVAIYQGEIIDEDDDQFKLAERIDQTHGSEFVLIRQVLAKRIVGRMESPELVVP